MENVKRVSPRLEEEFFDKIISDKNVILELPKTPAKWTVKAAKETPALCITMSCGGGLGGAQWKEIVLDVSFSELSQKTGLIRCKKHNGNNIMLNTNFIVKVEEIKILEATYNSQNRNFTIGDWTARWLARPYVKADLG